MPGAIQQPVTRWPRAFTVFLLLAYVLVDGALWLYGSYLLFMNDLVGATLPLLGAIVLMIFFGWMWQWWRVRGWLDGVPKGRYA